MLGVYVIDVTVAGADKPGKIISDRVNAPFNPTDDATETFVIPRSWAEHDSHPDLHIDFGESRSFATRVVSHSDHDEILVRYYLVARRLAVTRGRKAAEVGGPPVPKVVVEKGPKWFRASVSHNHRRVHNLDPRVDTSIATDRYGDATVHDVFRTEDVLWLTTQADLSFDTPQQILTGTAHYGLNLYIYVFICTNEPIQQLRYAVTNKRIGVHVVAAVAVDDYSAIDARDEIEPEAPIKISRAGKVRSRTWGHLVDFDAEPYTLATQTLERQKANVVVNIVEEAGASVGALNRYVGGGTTGQTWTNKTMDKTFQRAQAEVRDAPSEVETHPRGDNK